MTACWPHGLCCSRLHRGLTWDSNNQLLQCHDGVCSKGYEPAPPVSM